MNNVIELDKKWYTNKDVVRAVASVEKENETLKGMVVELLSIVQRNTSEMTVLKESVEHLTGLTQEVKDIAELGSKTTDEIKHTKFVGQRLKILDKARESVENISGGVVRSYIHRAAKSHPSGKRKGYTHIYEKLIDVTGFNVYEIGKIRLKKADNIDGWKKDPSYINAILKHGYGKETAIICKQILADK